MHVGSSSIFGHSDVSRYSEGAPHRIRVNLEVPEEWFGSSLDGERHRRMFTSLSAALAKMPVTIEMSIVPWGSYRAPRIAPENGVTFSFHSIGDVDNVWRLKETSIIDFYAFDRHGYSGWSSLARFPERYKAQVDSYDTEKAKGFVASLRDKLRNANTSKYTQSTEFFNPGRPYVYFPMQLLEDPVAEFNRVHPLAALEKAAEIAQKTGVLLVVKRHPLCRNEAVRMALDKVITGNSNVQVSSASVHNHLNGCQSVLVGNSGVGLEALLYDKPLFTFAASEYELASTPLLTVEDIEFAFQGNSKKTSEDRARFLAYYLNVWCFSPADAQSVNRFVTQSLENIMPTQSSAFVDRSTELMKAHAEVEHLRRAILNLQTDNAKLKKIADDALKISQQLNAATSSTGEAATEAVDFALKLQGAGFENRIEYRAMEKIACNAFSSYAELATKMRQFVNVDAELLRSGYAAGLDSSITHRNITASDYQKLHDFDAGYQANNWLVDHSNVIWSARPRTIVEVGCGNGRFLKKIAETVEKVVGLDWARSPLLGQLPHNVEFVRTNVLTDDIYPGDICCSADVLEHFEPDALPMILRKLHNSAPINYHVIACYDDGHSHCAVLHPGQWLGLFQALSSQYRLAAVIPRRSRPDQIVCVITNLPGAANFFPSVGNIVGTWATNSGQKVVFDQNFNVLIGGQAQAIWHNLSDGSVCIRWTENKMLDIATLSGGGNTLEIKNMKGEQFTVQRATF